MRPTLHLLAARMSGYRGPHAVLLRAVLEFIHAATLIHDDIIDEAATRRGRPSVNRRWGNNLTVLFGDYLFRQGHGDGAPGGTACDIIRSGWPR